MRTTRALLRTALAHSKMSRRKFALSLGCDHTHLSRILAGKAGLGPKGIGRALLLLDAESGAELIRVYLAEEEAAIYREQRKLRRRPASHPISLLRPVAKSPGS